MARFLAGTKFLIAISPSAWTLWPAISIDDENASRATPTRIDYKSLGVRHLGSIYEGLLEFKLRIAPEEGGR